MKLYRGDSYLFKVKGNRNFELGDVVRVGIKKDIDSEYLFEPQVIEIYEELEELNIEIPYSDTSLLNPGKYLLEIELTFSGRRFTIIQQKITVKGDVIV